MFSPNAAPVTRVDDRSDYEELTTTDRIHDPLNRCQDFSVTQQTLRELLDWRARRQENDPSSIEAQARFSEAFDRFLSSHTRRSPSRVLDPRVVAQEAWLVFLALEASGRLDGAGGEFPALLLTAIRHRLADLQRYHRRRHFVSLTEVDADFLIGREADPADLHERGRLIALVREVLEEARGHVPPSSYRIVTLRWIEGRTYAEVAAALEMPIERVRDRHRRAFSVLRVMIRRRLGMDPTGWFAMDQDQEFAEMAS